MDKDLSIWNPTRNIVTRLEQELRQRPKYLEYDQEHSQTGLGQGPRGSQSQSTRLQEKVKIIQNTAMNL